MELVIRVAVEPEFDDLPLPSEAHVLAALTDRLTKGEYVAEDLTFYVDTITVEQA